MENCPVKFAEKAKELIEFRNPRFTFWNEVEKCLELYYIDDNINIYIENTSITVVDLSWISFDCDNTVAAIKCMKDLLHAKTIKDFDFNQELYNRSKSKVY
jgi:hypothetical protein